MMKSWRLQLSWLSEINVPTPGVVYLGMTLPKISKKNPQIGRTSRKRKVSAIPLVRKWQVYRIPKYVPNVYFYDK